MLLSVCVYVVVRRLSVCEGDDEDVAVWSLRRVSQVLRQNDPDSRHRPLSASPLCRLSNQDPQTEAAAPADHHSRRQDEDQRLCQIWSPTPAGRGAGTPLGRGDLPALAARQRAGIKGPALRSGSVLRAGAGTRDDPPAATDATTADLPERGGRRADETGVWDGGDYRVVGGVDTGGTRRHCYPRITADRHRNVATAYTALRASTSGSCTRQRVKL